MTIRPNVVPQTPALPRLMTVEDHRLLYHVGCMDCELNAEATNPARLVDIIDSHQAEVNYGHNIALIVEPMSRES